MGNLRRYVCGFGCGLPWPLPMVAWSGIIIGILAVLVLGALFMRRSDRTESETVTGVTQTSVHAPCTSCGGPAHETINKNRVKIISLVIGLPFIGYFV